MDSIKLADTQERNPVEIPEEERPSRKHPTDSMGLPEDARRTGGAQERPDAESGTPVRHPVLMTIKAEQDFESFQPERMELMTEGVLERSGDRLTLTYEESELTGMEGTTTAIEIQGPRLTLRRTGTVCSQMVFEEGVQHTSLYETPYGELSVDIRTSSLRHSLTEFGGLLEICYSVSVEHASTGKNRFLLLVKRKAE